MQIAGRLANETDRQLPVSHVELESMLLRTPSKQHETHIRDRLKCNRASPCDTCIRLRKQCEYSDNANRNKPKQRNTGDRLQNLENLVLQFVQNGTPGQLQDERETSESTDHPGTSTTSADTLIDERGTLHDRGGQMNYVDSSHWLSILNEIKEVREQLSNNQAQEEPSTRGMSSQPEVDLVFDPMQPSTLREILQSLPPRTVCDSLLSQYFNSQYLILRRIPILMEMLFAYSFSYCSSTQVSERI